MTTHTKPPRIAAGQFQAPLSSDWQNQAECRSGYDIDLWFPAGMTGPFAVQIQAAKDVCRRRCPVMEECLTWALETRQEAGIWGGLDEIERQKLLRRAEQRATRLRVQDGRRLAIDNGIDVLTLLAKGVDEQRMCDELGCSSSALRQAKRLLLPERVTPRAASSATPLERLLWDIAGLRRMRDSGMTAVQIGREVMKSPVTVRDALAILKVRDAFLSGRAQLGVAA